ncbi:beta-class phenol-soluble modulin [Staphylococcus sp. SQ8-PEA]|uniref:Beta-class phenol-soluble modulin n=1 Tax=Staphylococcus marylandisciuri TaxID=2981529 RepID=A0ABT2QRR1_9STAP|nr:beta-class phenol-soluble modulin [Staphylococcus marylandisciuri]MCU5746648.1 beta-class phenol-soluble modulin [Staphylococcus marylandisciuri]
MEGIVKSISEAVKAGLDKDWATMGTSIAEALAKGVDFISGFFG